MTSVQLLRQQTLARLTAVGGPLAAPLLFLIKAEFVVNPDLVFEDLEEADFSGYARPGALVFGAPFQNGNGEWEIVAPSEQFMLTAVTVQNTIYGWGIVTAAGDDLLIAELLPEPIALTEVNDGLIVLPRYLWGR